MSNKQDRVLFESNEIVLKEATLLGSIHTVKSGNIKVNILDADTPTNKAVAAVLKGNFVELTVRKTKEKILVPFTYFSHLVPKE